jgi:hypothetical protein
VLVQNDCYLLRSLLRADEQATLFQYIQEQDRTPWDTLTRVMVPAPKTLMFGDNQPSLQFKCGQNSLVGDMVETANEIWNETISAGVLSTTRLSQWWLFNTNHPMVTSPRTSIIPTIVLSI